MKKQEYKLKEAIREFYNTDDLRIDLARTVNERIMKQLKSAARIQRWFTWTAISIIAIGLGWSFSYLVSSSIAMVLASLLVMIPMAWLGWVEYTLLKKKLNAWDAETK